ncbi:MAG: 3-dehydro-L-gulonate 2-dehydrogenase [Acidobacteriota bacterium]|jgi:3-dehydro-L-gulonate 2-dehydrogenase|nr:3-dehydro-L-gulonate 2-dehydrogenase [Acidobacteriota bacterium]
MRVSYDELYQTLRRALLKVGFEQGRAELCARLFAETDRDGVYTHGLNRFPRFLEMIEKGIVEVSAQPFCVEAHGALERWDGRAGAGNLNAHESMARAIELSRQYGVGCVALRNTNHWMRGGSYGWQAAEAGALAFCWTNTLPNLPPWGSTRSLLGNNPLVIAVPRPAGHVVLDMAMSQFSYGALAAYRSRGEQLPVDGGFDIEGRLTRDPGAIEESGRPLPIGFWKGSGLALLLDMAAALLAGGLATHQIPPDPLEETRLSQVFLAFDLTTLGGTEAASRIADDIIESLQSGGEGVRYPGERTLNIRRENIEKGIPVEPSVWEQVRNL